MSASTSLQHLGHGSKRSAQLLRLRIVDLRTGQIKVMLALPINLVNVAQRLGARLLPPDVAIERVVEQATREGVAELAWIDEQHGERLELTVE
ncbi:hypothetical protein [Kallotenue papyrolyticum]|uniref:hypothetical protein n=1 Tax=Kallotenue papyrolyticum TaxID=1325125 RepID=UPI0004786479|nr:hypothetical protein [Kallotenue papyrolyticum]